MSEVLVIGGANLDIKAKTTAQHIAATSNPAEILSRPGGVARNIAHNLARLGVETKLMSVVGSDPAGQTVLESTKAAGVDTSLVKVVDASTGTYIAVLDQNGTLVTAINDMRVLDQLTVADIETHTHHIARAKYVVADCNLSIDVLIALARLAGHKLIVEPVSVPKSAKLASLMASQQIFLATPNLDQMQALTQMLQPETAARKLFGMGLRQCVIHAGADGAFTFDGTDVCHIPAQARQIVDVTGAGDAATAGLVAGLLRGQTLASAASFGQELAARVIKSNSSHLD